MIFYEYSLKYKLMKVKSMSDWLKIIKITRLLIWLIELFWILKNFYVKNCYPSQWYRSLQLEYFINDLCWYHDLILQHNLFLHPYLRLKFQGWLCYFKKPDSNDLAKEFFILVCQYDCTIFHLLSCKEYIIVSLFMQR